MKAVEEVLAIHWCQSPAQEVEVVVMAKKNVGSSFDEFLEEEGLFEKATAAAVKRVIAALTTLEKEGFWPPAQG